VAQTPPSFFSSRIACRAAQASAARVFPARTRPAAKRQAEVHDPDSPATVHHDVRGLEITMQYTAVVRGG
jgi:hypothetical protein